MYSKQNRVTPVDRREMLRVKLKSLAYEAKCIRREEKKTFGVLQHELWWHRISVVRGEARSTHIAYTLIRGKPLSSIEAKADTPPNWRRVRAMCRKYGPASMYKLADNNDSVEPVVREELKLAA